MLRASGGFNGTQRYNDATCETVYHYVINTDKTVNTVTWTAKLGGQLLLLVSQDDKNWVTIQEYVTDDAGRGIEKGVYSFDLTKYVDLANNPNIYIRIADSYPADGWGGSIYADETVVLVVSYGVAGGEDPTPEEPTPEEPMPDLDARLIDELVVYGHALTAELPDPSVGPTIMNEHARMAKEKLYFKYLEFSKEMSSEEGLEVLDRAYADAMNSITACQYYASKYPDPEVLEDTSMSI